jgi:hypothetical protein
MLELIKAKEAGYTLKRALSEDTLRGIKGVFIFGHLGIGSKMAFPWRDVLPRTALLAGTVLPDLIDKPLYYGLIAVRGRDAAAQSLISGSRTFGHTLLLLTVIIFIAFLRRSRVAAALAVGVTTHHLIDLIGDKAQVALGLIQLAPGSDGVQALLWPLMGWGFPISASSMLGHGLQIINPWILGGEVLGVCILLWDYRRRALRH